MAGGHFFPDDPPASIARKALRVNLSDLAAKGADPLGFTLALALPPDWTAAWLGAFARGLGEDAAAYGCPLLGGDTVKAVGPLTLSITAFGAVPAGRMVPRTGARPGDRLYVSGTIGDAALGLQLRLAGAAAPARAGAPARPLPPPAAPPRAARGAAPACVGRHGRVGRPRRRPRQDDARLGHLGRRSTSRPCRCPAAARLAVAGRPEAFDAAVTGGDDYEILASVPEREAAAFEAAAAAAGVPVAAIGRVSEASGPVSFRGPDGAARSFARGSFSHF